MFGGGKQRHKTSCQNQWGVFLGVNKVIKKIYFFVEKESISSICISRFKNHHSNYPNIILQIFHCSLFLLSIASHLRSTFEINIKI